MEPGSIFASRYRVARRIAMGGMGAVYEVTHTATERRFALKVMLPEFAQEIGLRERFQHEARVAARVESEYIVDVVDAGLDESSGTLFLVMELLRGEELGARVRRLGRITPSEVITCLRQAASALDKTHAASIVHRDLKPENLFLTWREDGSVRVKVLDFGIAKVLAESTTAKRRTESIGTPLYMAPEQFGGIVPSSATDIYALGLIAYTLLVGEPYWEEEAASLDNALAFALKASLGPTEDAVTRASRRGAWLPAAFGPWFSKATHREPSQRFKLASECVAALATVLSGEIQPINEGEPQVLSAEQSASNEAVRPHIVLTATAPALEAGAAEPAAEVVASKASLPNVIEPNLRGAAKESSAHSLSVSSVPGHPSQWSSRWRSWAAAGLVVAAATAILVQRTVVSDPEVEASKPDLGVVTGSIPGQGEVVTPNRSVVVVTPTASEVTSAIAIGSASAATTTPPSPTSPAEHSPITNNSSDTAHAPAAATSTATATPSTVATSGSGSVVSRPFCYEHPDSARILPYKAGVSLRGQGIFPCKRTSNGEYRRAK